MSPSSSTTEPTLSDVINVYIKFVIEPTSEDSQTEEKRIRNFVLNLQREGTDNLTIYELVESMNPHFGSPITFYECNYLEVENEVDRSVETAHKAERKVLKQAAEVSARVSSEFSNKRKCIELEKQVRNKQTKTSCLTTAKSTPISAAKKGVIQGDYVDVLPDLSPGKYCHGGTGYVINTYGEGAAMTFTVKFDEFAAGGKGRVENGIPWSRITERRSPFGATRTERNRKSPEILTAEQPPTPAREEQPKAIHEVLKQGCTSGRRAGWRAKDLGVYGELQTDRFRNFLIQDTKELQGYLAAKPESNQHTKDRARSGKFKPRKNVHNPLSIKYLAKAWGVGRKFPTVLLKSQNEMPPLESHRNCTREHVIDSLEAAANHYTAKTGFMEEAARGKKAESDEFAYDGQRQKELRYEGREESKADWCLLPDKEKEMWGAIARAKISRQANVRDDIICSLRSNPSKSFEQVATDIGNWCSASTIHHWMDGIGYCKYVEQTLPLLTKVQMKKHVAFSKHLRSNWGLPRRKTLWVHYDEKWFYGLVCRAMAKKCEALGIEKTHTYLYHKNHVEKVMAVAFTGFAFDRNIENGGEGIMLGFYRVQGARVAKKRVRESSRDDEGNLHYDGPIRREKGDAYLIDCTVTGSDHGTSDKPKFALLELFRDHVFPEIMELVRPGGKYDGYTVVIQGDNAGPHQDGTFFNGVTDFCHDHGWHWEPQAPQMPHMNNLDLAVFPCMSKRHSNLLKNYSNKMAPPEEIWKAANEVWANLESCTIARGFVLANRIAETVIACKGSNEFLQKAEFHSNVRKDFQDTPTGVKKRVRVVD